MFANCTTLYRGIISARKAYQWEENLTLCTEACVSVFDTSFESICVSKAYTQSGIYYETFFQGYIMKLKACVIAEDATILSRCIYLRRDVDQDMPVGNM